jgi:isocitrate dehydrogenase kinase/phosphatase
MDNEVWYPVAANDVFPEEFATFILTDPAVRAVFLAHHADLLDAQWWQATQRRLASGALPEVLSYPDHVRFTAPAAAR